MVEAICYVLRTAIAWRDMPACYGPWNSVYTRWRRWCALGLWQEVLRLLSRHAVGHVSFVDGLSPGQTYEVEAFAPLLVTLKNVLLVGDKSFDADALREKLLAQGCLACIPPRSSRCDPAWYHRGFIASDTESRTSSSGSKSTNASPPVTKNSPSLS